MLSDHLSCLSVCDIGVLWCIVPKRLDGLGCLPYFHTWCGLSANLDCRSEMCCTWLAKKYRAVSLQLRHISTIGKKLLNSNTSSTCPHNMANFGPLTAEIGSGVWDTPQISTAFASSHRYAATSLAGCQSNFLRRLTVSWAATLYLHFRGLLPHNGIFPGARFTLRPSLAFSDIGSVTARHSSSGRQRNFVALSRGRRLYSAGQQSCWTLAHILVFFFARLISAVADWMSTILPHGVALVRI